MYFRISEDEFRQFVSVCEQEGARSVSDLARSAVQRLIADGKRAREGDELAQNMHRLEELIAAVTVQLQLLSTGKSQPAAMNEFSGSTDGCSTDTNITDHNGRRGE